VDKQKKPRLDSFVENVKVFSGIHNFFYNHSQVFWFWNADQCCFEIVDYIDLMIKIDRQFKFNGKIIGGRMKMNYVEAFKFIGRMNVPMEPPLTWIQFKDTVYDFATGEKFPATSDYFHTNPIQHRIGDSTDTPTMDRLFTEWVGEKYVQDLYEILAYCCYRDYPIQVLFCFVGSGRNGKSQFMKILDHFLGHNNVTATELDTLLGSRFESFKLYRKLACSIGETNFGILSQSSLIKKLIGGDKISFEMKNKKPFEGLNYAKILINSNSLPISTDTSDGFYRRWYIIDFPNEFPESGKEVWLDVPVVEYQNLARKVINILPKLLSKGTFNNQGTIEQRRQKYIEQSNPFCFFLNSECEIHYDAYVKYNDLYNEYLKYLFRKKKRRVSRKEFKLALEDEGLFIEKSNLKNHLGFYEHVYWIRGVRLKCQIPIETPVQMPDVQTEFIN